MSDQFPGRPGDDDDDQRLQELLKSMLGGREVDPQMLEAFRSMGLDQMDPQMLQMVSAQVQAMMSGGDEGPVNIQLATDVARKSVAAEGDPSVSDRTRSDVEQVAQVADLWLDEVTDHTRPSAPAQAWSRAEWVERTMPTWQTLVAPVATGVGEAIKRAMQQQMRELGDAGQLGELPPELGLPPGTDLNAMMDQMQPMMARMSSAMFGMQTGQAVGALAGELVTGTEVGLPLIEGNAVVVLPANVAAFAEGLGIDAGEVHLYLVARESARARLFTHVGWLSPALLAAVQSYAGDIRIDTDRIEQAMNQANMSDPQELQKALQNSLFSPEPSAEQQRALVQLERLLALVEGWVDVVAQRACAPHLPHVDALSEAVRRRRAAGGASEKLFSSLVGLQLRPKLLREAATIFAGLEEHGGAAARDEVWSHPDRTPTAEDLDDPSGYLARLTGAAPAEDEPDEMDAALEELLNQGRAEMDAEEQPNSDDSDDSEGEPDGKTPPTT
ncbi:zinc-dependent metalloprotease [Dermacoccaceae bacterium W4C1]